PVAITGTNFTGTTAVSFGATPAASFTVNSATSITAVSPAAGASTVDSTVATPGGTSATSANDLFTFSATASPTVTSLTPSSGPTGGGSSVVIAGTNFTTGSTVTFGGVSATTVTVNSAFSITAVAPATLTPGVVDVIVTASGGTSNNTSADDFTYNAVQPAITSLSPNNGPSGGGTSVTITGSNFINGASVNFGTTAATGVVVNSSTSITAVSPGTLTPGQVDVRVITSGGTSAVVTGDHFT